MSIYARICQRLSTRTLDDAPQPGRHHTPARVGYYLWRFPLFSETFIQREILALCRGGLDVIVFADGVQDESLWDATARSLAASTHYLHPRPRRRMLALTGRYLRRHPRLFLNLLAFTIGHRYGPHKSLDLDLDVFSQAINLAGHLEKAGVTHLHSPWANTSAFIALLAARLVSDQGTPITYSVQARASADLFRTGARLGLAERLGYASFIITGCQFNARFIRSQLPPGSQSPIHVIYEGLDPAQFEPPPREPGAHYPVKLLTVARMIEEKGLAYLLQALHALKASGRSFHCEIAGPAEPAAAQYHQALLALCEALGLQDVLTFLGPLPFDQVLNRYAAADIFVLPSVVAASGGRDVTPNVLLEAMAMSLPVVSTNMTGIPELVTHGESGLLVPPRNVPALAQALARLIDDPLLRRSLGAAGRQRIQEHFDIDKNIHHYLTLFNAS